MSIAISDRTGVLILRLWIETGHETGLRARITQTLDTMGGKQSVAIASSADDICAIIKHWVDDFESAGPRAGNGDVTPVNDNSAS